MVYYKAYPHHTHASCLLVSWLTECQMWCDAEVALLNLEGSKLPINSVQKKKKVFVSAFTFGSAWYSPASASVGPPQKQLLASGLGTKQSSLGAKGLAYLLNSSWLYLSHSHPLLPCISFIFSSVQSLSCVRLFATSRITTRQASLSITNSWSSFKLMSIESVMPSSHLILCRPLLLLPPIPPSIRVFSNKSTLRMRWPKYWSFSFSIIPSSKHPGLISFRMDWLDLLAVQGTLKSLLQHHSSKASILRHLAFFTVQLSHPYMTTGKTIALMRQTLLAK